MQERLLKKYEQEVRNELVRLGKNFKPVQESYFNSELQFIAAIPMATQRSIHKKGFSFTSKEDPVKVWDAIWKRSECFEVLNQCLFHFELKHKRIGLDLSDWKVLKTWGKKVDNWAHSDSLSSLYAILHENNPDILYPEFVKWNKKPNPWLRRLSIVSLYYYSAQRKNPLSFKKALPMVKNLLADDHLYVQKGVGWTLREMYNIYPVRTLRLIDIYVGLLHPAAWQAATEKLSAKDKALLKEKRRSLRGK